jgi:hypothetical protein
MYNTIKATAASVKSSNSNVTRASVTMFNHFVRYLGILTMVGCLTVWFGAPVAHAQELLGHQAASASTGITTGWWSPDIASSAASPHFLLSTAGLPNFEAFDSLKTSTAQSHGSLPGDPMDNYVANLTDGGSLPSISFLALVQTSYVQWESSLADTPTPTSVNGAMVYPLMQVNYAGWNLPVALYTSPLRGY